MFGWTIAFGIGMSVIYGPFTVFKTDGDSFNRTENIFYGAFSRLAWALALGWVIYACHNKMGGKYLADSFAILLYQHAALTGGVVLYV